MNLCIVAMLFTVVTLRNTAAGTNSFAFVKQIVLPCASFKCIYMTVKLKSFWDFGKHLMHCASVLPVTFPNECHVTDNIRTNLPADQTFSDFLQNYLLLSF
jgi:hypothetical protein